MEEALIFFAYLEVYRFQVTKAKKCLADREAQDKISKDREKYLADAASIDNQISALNRSQARFEQQKTYLLTRRKTLVQKLAQVDADMIDVENNLAGISPSIVVHKENKESLIQQARRLEKNVKPIPGSTSHDQKRNRISRFNSPACN